MTTLAELTVRIRQMADKVNSTFVSDAEIMAYTNSSYAELYDLIIQSDQDYFTTTPVAFTLASGDNGIYALPADFYKLRGVDYQLGGNYVTVYPYDWNERNSQNGVANIVTSMDIRYRLMGANLRIEPKDNATGSYQLWYIPAYTPLTTSASVLNTQITKQNWEEYLVLDVARKILDKEESNSQHLFRAKEILRGRIVEFAGNRDMDQPIKISNTRANNGWGWW